MKRISTSSLSTALQLPSQAISFAQKLSNISENNIRQKKTVLSNQMITLKPTLVHFPYSLFAECFTSTFETQIPEKTYRKLRYHSLDKKEIKDQQKNNQEQKTISLKNSILSFGKQKISCESDRITLTKSINQCVIADTVGAQDNLKCNVFNGTKNTGRSSLMVSTRNTINERLQEYQSSLNTKLFLSQDFKIYQILSPIQPIGHTKTDQKNLEKINFADQNQNIVKERRLSTNDSTKLRENFQTDQSQATNSPLQIVSILCQSIPVKQQYIYQQNTLQFDRMKDSLIDKLSLFRNQESFIQSKRKSFIRSNKKISPQSPRFRNFEPDSWDNKQKSHQNEQEFTDFQQIDSKQTIQQKLIRKKFKTLKECGKTIVSKYNKSSQQKSILQESNIFFQASKMCTDPHDQKLKIPTFSDSQVVFDNQVKENFDNDKPYNSFSHEVDSRENQGLQASDPKCNNVGKKLSRAFLRSKKFSSQKQIRCINNDQMEIRFDLDTFIEYGPL